MSQSSACLRHVRQQIAEIHAALAVLGKDSRDAHEPRGFFADEGKAHVLCHAVRQRLAVEFVELRLRIEEIHLARPALKEDEDAVLRLRREMRLPTPLALVVRNSRRVCRIWCSMGFMGAL
jgi:hypothetical protein